MGSSAYMVKKTSIEVVTGDPETRSQERSRRSSSRPAAMDRLSCGDDECDNRSTHSVDGSFESFSRTSSCQASSAARQAHRTMSHETMSSSEADGESFGSGSLEDTFSGTDDAFSEDGEEGEEVEGSWSTGKSSERVIAGVGQWSKHMAAKLDQVKQEEPETLDTTADHFHNASNQRRYLHMVLMSKLLRKMQVADGRLEDGVAESSDQAGQDVCNMIISL